MSRLVLSVSLAAATMAVAADPLPPALAATTLTDRAFAITADLPPEPAAVVVGFSRNAREQTSEWGRRLAQRLAVYQVAVLEEVPSLFRRFVIGSIRADVPHAMRDRFLVVAQGADQWKALCSHSEPDAACVLLVDAGRNVAWTTRGEADDAAVAAFLARLAALPDPPAGE